MSLIVQASLCARRLKNSSEDDKGTVPECLVYKLLFITSEIVMYLVNLYQPYQLNHV